jgi:hypothetical protein
MSVSQLKVPTRPKIPPWINSKLHPDQNSFPKAHRRFSSRMPGAMILQQIPASSGEVVKRMCETLERDAWKVVRDKTAMRYGDLISGFMKTLSQADCVIVVLSAKYLRSPYCMAELHGIYQRSVGEKEDFLRRVIPLVLADARFGTWRDRVLYAEHWEKEFKAMEGHLSRIPKLENPTDRSEMKKLLSELSDSLFLFALLAVLTWSVYLISTPRN